MGCLNNSSSKQDWQASSEEMQALQRMQELINSRRSGKVSIAELEVIRQTFLSLQNVEETRRQHWLETINDVIVSPLYYSLNTQHVYSEENPFVLDPAKQAALADKDFPVLSQSKDQLREGLIYIYHDFITEYDFDLVKFQRFLFAVTENYKDNPFHNAYHGFAVTQMLYVIATRTQRLSAFMGFDDVFALLISAIGHDLNHPGVTNNFMVNSRHPLAVRYNDISVLENHHAAMLIHILELEGCDFLAKWSVEDRNRLRKQLIPTILATDMAKHNQVVEEMRSIEYDSSSPVHRQHLIDLLMHAADVGNPTLKFDLATVWSLKIIKEFNQQVWEEEQRGLPVSEFLRVVYDLDRVKQHQIGFIDNIILPLWRVVSNAVPGVEDFVECIEANKDNWQAIESLDSL